jgi:hypothetical protein
MFTRALHWSSSSARWIQFISPHPVSLRSNHRSGLYHLDPPPKKKHVCIRTLQNACYMPCPTHLPWIDHSNCTCRRVMMTLFITQFSPTSCHFITLRSKYSPQHTVLKHPQALFLP